MKVIILPGNGCTNILRSNWYGWLKTTLESQNIECVAENMPDPYGAKRNVWIPFIHDQLKADTDTILVGHSSGAQAALRYAEEYPVKGIILVSATYTDLGDSGERASGYYPQNSDTTNRYNFEAMRANCSHWKQFHSDDDCFIPLHEAERIRDGLD
jgi:predicted alpha/beta hydrolase family esterase